MGRGGMAFGNLGAKMAATTLEVWCMCSGNIGMHLLERFASHSLPG